MEIQAKTIAFDDRMEHILRNSENQLANKKKFPWDILIAFGLVCVGATIIVLTFIDRKKEQKQNEK